MSLSFRSQLNHLQYVIFPPGCGRYASPVTPESYTYLPQRCLILPVSTSGDYSFGYGKNVSLMINKQCLLASAPNCHSNGVKDSSRQLFKLNFHSLAKESVKSRANLETNFLKQDNGSENNEGSSCILQQRIETCFHLDKHGKNHGIFSTL